MFQSAHRRRLWPGPTTIGHLAGEARCAEAWCRTDISVYFLLRACLPLPPTPPPPPPSPAPRTFSTTPSRFRYTVYRLGSPPRTPSRITNHRHGHQSWPVPPHHGKKASASVVAACAPVVPHRSRGGHVALQLPAHHVDFGPPQLHLSLQPAASRLHDGRLHAGRTRRDLLSGVPEGHPVHPEHSPASLPAVGRPRQLGARASLAGQPDQLPLRRSTEHVCDGLHPGYAGNDNSQNKAGAVIRSSLRGRHTSRSNSCAGSTASQPRDAYALTPSQ